jgi:type II secretory pathway pseudopilin PulG
MKNQGLTLLEVAVIVVVIGILAALLVPPICGPRRRPRQLACQSNLHQLYKLGTVHASMHKGAWPDATGKDLWLSFRKMVPPLIETDHAGILNCDVLEHELGPDETNYRGPIAAFNRLGPGSPLGGDKPGNHGDEYGGNLLLKDGSVQELAPGDALWKKCRDLLSP